MKKILPLMLLCGVALWAADFWAAKPYTDWNEKELQKLSSDSPWAKQVTVSMGDGGVGSEGSSKGGRSKGGGGGGSMPNDIAGAENGGGLGPGGGMSVSITVRWQSALPVKEALVKMKFGAEAGTSAEAKKILELSEPDYVVVISGLSRGLVRGDAEQIKSAMLANTEIAIKGKESLKPKDFRLLGQGRVDAVFAFPRTNPITEDDKDIEFRCKVGTITVKQKFHLKDMMFNGKLEL